MAASAAFTGTLGVAASSLPQEILTHAGTEPTPLAVLLVQAAGALYLGFAILDWMARGVLIGGVYARPVAMGNFLHFAAVAIALVKQLFALGSPLILALALAYGVFAGWYGMVLFTHPVKPVDSGTRS